MNAAPSARFADDTNLLERARGREVRRCTENALP